MGRRVGRQARLSRKRSFANRQPPATPIRLANKDLILRRIGVVKKIRGKNQDSSFEVGLLGYE